MSDASPRAAEALIEKADEALAYAKLLTQHGSPPAAINRAHYAAFSAARAALLTEKESPNTHAGVIRRFGFHFVRTGRVSKEMGDVLSVAETMRGKADYDIFSVFDQHAAEELTNDTERFTQTIKHLVL